MTHMNKHFGSICSFRSTNVSQQIIVFSRNITEIFSEGVFLLLKFNFISVSAFFLSEKQSLGNSQMLGLNQFLLQYNNITTSMSWFDKLHLSKMNYRSELSWFVKKRYLC